MNPKAGLSATIPIEALGEPGTFQELWVEGVPPGPPGKPNVGKGPFEVQVFLARVGGRSEAEGSINFGAGSGDSYWQLGGVPGKPVLGLQATVTARETGAPIRTNQVEAFSNAQGRVSYLIVKAIEANGLREARRIGLDHLVPFLARVSFEADRPLVIDKVETRCITTGAQHREYRAPYSDFSKKIEVGRTEGVNRACQAALAVYMEGLASNSPSYAFLCFYRVAEILLHYRTRRSRATKGKSNQLRTAVAFPTSDPELAGEHSDVLGKPFEEVLFGSPLKDIRGDVGHGTGAVKDVQDDDKGFGPGLLLLEPSRLKGWFPVLRHMARALLTEELRLQDAD